MKLVIFDSEKKCKVPNGDAGNCVSINICPPLKSLYKKKHKTVNENRFIRQSICGSRDSDPIKVSRFNYSLKMRLIKICLSELGIT